MVMRPARSLLSSAFSGQSVGELGDAQLIPVGRLLVLEREADRGP
jgi:hypothetical protein